MDLSSHRFRLKLELRLKRIFVAAQSNSSSCDIIAHDIAFDLYMQRSTTMARIHYPAILDHSLAYISHPTFCTKSYNRHCSVVGRMPSLN